MFDPPDTSHIATTLRLSPGMRLQRLLDARALLAALVRARLRRELPHLSPREINLLLIEELQGGSTPRP